MVGMKLCFIQVIFLSVLMVSCQQGFCQEKTKSYSIKVAGFTIGDLTATTFQKDTLTYYVVHSVVDFWLLFRVKIDYKVESYFYKNQLWSSTAITHSSKGDFESTTFWKGDHYTVKVNAYKYKKDTVIRHPIEYTVAKLFFEKPKKGQKVYADNYGLITYAKRSDKKDAFTVPVFGNNNMYFYDKNSLLKAEMYNPIKNYFVKLKSSEEQ